MSKATLEKTIIIEVDSTTITKDIQLMFAFEDMAGGADFENIAWRVSNVPYNPPTQQNVPIAYKATLAFSIASVTSGKYVVPGSVITMGLQESVKVIKLDDQQTFQDRAKAKDLEHNQIRAFNTSEMPVGLAVGFVNEAENFESAGFIPDLGNDNNWVATYTPHMNLYITSDAQEGQVISTIAKSGLVYTWKLEDDVKVPDQSRWKLEMKSSGEYKITATKFE